MEIQWFGRTCVSLRGKKADVLIDPFLAKDQKGSLRKCEPSLVLGNEHDPSLDTSPFQKQAKIFDWPGEYESGGVMVQAIPAYSKPRDKEEKNSSDAEESIMIFTLHVDGFRICHLGNIGHKLTPEMLEQIGDIDILLVPISGNLSPEKAHEIIEQIEPRVVIPMNYEDPKKFLSELGVQSLEPVSVAKFQTLQSLPTDKMDVLLLAQA